MPIKVDDYVSRLEVLKGIRGNWDDHWQEASELVLPRRSDFTVNRAKGEKRTLQAIDSTGIIANELLGAGMHGMLTNPASKWFTLNISIPDFSEDEEVQKWLGAVADRIFAEMNGPNAAFSTHVHEFYLDLTAFGTAVMFIGKNDVTNDLSFSTRHLGECYLAENADGKVDTVYRVFPFTVKQIVQKWAKNKPTEKNVGKTVLDAWNKQKFDMEFHILHAVQPRTDFKHKSKRADNLPIVSAYILKEEKFKLEESGFAEMPYIAARWMKVAGETYGRGPGLNTLPDVKMLQEIVKTVLKAAQKIVDPPLVVPDDGFLNPVRTIPGGLNFKRAGADNIEPLQTNANIPIGLELIQDVRARIREGFFIDQLQLQQGPQMTATEVLQRTEEKLRLLGPVLGRLQSEMLGPMIQRVFGVLARNGRLPEPPSQLEGVDYDIEYVSPLARAQRQVEANSLLRVFEIGSPVLQLQPQSGEVFKGEDTIRWLSDLFGVPHELLKTDEALADERQQQQQRQNLGDGLAAAEQGATVLEKVANAGRQ